MIREDVNELIRDPGAFVLEFTEAMILPHSRGGRLSVPAKKICKLDEDSSPVQIILHGLIFPVVLSLDCLRKLMEEGKVRIRARNH